MNNDFELFDVKTKTLKVGEHDVTFETGRMAKNAGGSVFLTCGETALLITACGVDKPREGTDFFPLTIDVEERMYSVGRLPGGFIKREGRPSEKAVLMCRLIDRPIRPLWPDGYHNDVQVVVTVMSSEEEQQIDVLGILGASMALELAGLPFLGPLGAVRVGRIDSQFVINPTHQQQENSDLDLVVAGTAESIMMVEAGANFINEEDLAQALEIAHEEVKKQVQAQAEFAKECGVEKQAFEFPHDLQPLKNFVAEQCASDVNKAYHEFDRDKRKEILTGTKEKLDAAIEALPEDNDIKKFLEEQAMDYKAAIFKKLEKQIMRAMIIEEGVRADGRRSTDIRPINCQVGILPRTHGSALFTRGSTQALSVCTLGAPGEAQSLDGVDPAREKRWIHHYAFPPYSVGEVRFMRGPGRREQGHGALAERAVSASLPTKEDFPYTVRVNSDILESNGSSSMASTCGATMALMDAGVPLTTIVGGIAMGLIKEDEHEVVLSDIQGIEDFLGDMDFKVTGSEDGVTALQMDIKIQGISIELMRRALEQARQGRLHIIQKMTEAISEPRKEMSPYAPRILSFFIDTDSIGAVIGPGGKTIRGIIEETGATIDIEDNGFVTITSTGDGGEKAKEIVEQLTMKIEPGMTMVGKVVRIIPIGAFVELAPGKDGMVHISQVVNRRINTIEEELSVGDEVLVRVKEVDDRGRINLTIKGVPNEVREEHGFPPLAPPEPRGDRGPYPSDRGGPRGGGGHRGGGGGHRGRDRSN